MKILLVSYLFSPSIGGVETVGRLLADQFVRLGHKVTVVTNTPGCDLSSTYATLRQPSPAVLWKAIRWADVVLHNNISLRFAWPSLLLRKPLVVSSHIWISRPDGTRGPTDRLKLFALRLASARIAVSAALAASLPGPTTVIQNPYDTEIFRDAQHPHRDRDLLFLGRLVSDKGVDLLIESLALLRDTYSISPTLTIVGDGPEREALKQQTATLELSNQVTFQGAAAGKELRTLLNRHRIMVVPSRWNEPFGIVALEGIACGCVVIGSQGAGLSDAIGPCGLTFPNGDVSALAHGLRDLLTGDLNRFRNSAPTHLERHAPERVARAYLEVLERVVTE